MTGVSRLKWDANVRMKQAKLRGNGEEKTREEAIRVIINERAEEARLGVLKRFEEMARERGFHDSSDAGERVGCCHKPPTNA